MSFFKTKKGKMLTDLKLSILCLLKEVIRAGTFSDTNKWIMNNLSQLPPFTDVLTHDSSDGDSSKSALSSTGNLTWTQLAGFVGDLRFNS